MPTTAASPVTDDDVIASCAEVVDRTKAAAPSSFVLHAPLELLARALLLERAPEHVRTAAHERVRWLADTYAAAGQEADPQPEPADVGDDALLVSLAAAGHAPILRSLRSRVPLVGVTFGERLVAAEVARTPDWVLEWPARRRSTGRGSGDLAARLAAPRSPGDPGSDFIYPTMHLTDVSGLAEEVLDEPLRGMTVDEARRVLLRTAARSMLQDDPKAAPYGWTHCLTMPQAVLVAADRGADPQLAIGVAATYVLGFRATQGRVPLDPAHVPPPGTSAGRAWAARRAERDEVVDELVTFGLLHEDAHVAKYTLACLDAAEADPDAAPLFLAAAAHLHDWWRASDSGVA